MNEHKEYILKTVDRRELYELLAEECSELAKAALKCIRAEKLSRNVTPVTSTEAHMNLCEELSDVLMVLVCLGLKVDSSDGMPMSPKWERWANRLKAAKKKKGVVK